MFPLSYGLIVRVPLTGQLPDLQTPAWMFNLIFHHRWIWRDAVNADGNEVTLARQLFKVWEPNAKVLYDQQRRLGQNANTHGSDSPLEIIFICLVNVNKTKQSQF